MNKDRCDSVIQFALLEAGRQDEFNERELGPIHLIKYVYLADLDFAARNQGATFTEARWTFYHYGPWAQEVHERIEPALAAIDAAKQVIQSSRYDEDFVRWRKTDDDLHAQLERSLPLPVVSSIRRNVRKYGKDTGELLHYVYTTSPMRRAAPRDALVFRVAEPAESAPPETEQTVLSARQEKKRRAAAAEARQAIKTKLAARRAERAKRATSVAPRYDELFFKGLGWLDEISAAGEESGEAEFDEEVWTSDTRGDDRD